MNWLAKSSIDALIVHPVYTTINGVSRTKSYNDDESRSRQLGHCSSSVRHSQSRFIASAKPIKIRENNNESRCNLSKISRYRQFFIFPSTTGLISTPVNTFSVGTTEQSRHRSCCVSFHWISREIAEKLSKRFLFFLEANVALVPDVDSTINSRDRISSAFPDLARRERAAVVSTQSVTSVNQQPSGWTKNPLPKHPSARHRTSTSNRRYPASPAICRNHHWTPAARRSIIFHGHQEVRGESIKRREGIVCEIKSENTIICEKNEKIICEILLKDILTFRYVLSNHQTVTRVSF